MDPAIERQDPIFPPVFWIHDVQGATRGGDEDSIRLKSEDLGPGSKHDLREDVESQ